jgi:hypothetical protein
MKYEIVTSAKIYNRSDIITRKKNRKKIINSISDYLDSVLLSVDVKNDILVMIILEIAILCWNVNLEKNKLIRDRMLEDKKKEICKTQEEFNNFDELVKTLTEQIEYEINRSKTT